MANFNLGQDVTNKREKEIDNYSYSGQLAVTMSRYGSLINMYPLFTRTTYIFRVQFLRKGDIEICTNKK